MQKWVWRAIRLFIIFGVVRLGISDDVAMTGWVSAESFPAYLRVVDIMINPSVRGWSETFCIANIEAMAMRIPLVTLGVGGVGEYIELTPEHERELEALKIHAKQERLKRRALYRDSRVDASTNSTGAGEDRDWEHEDYGDDYLRKDYTVTSNAILVHSAHPLSLAGAVMYLLEHPEERERLGGAGRATVETYFKTVDQMWKYANLYRFLASRRKSRAQ